MAIPLIAAGLSAVGLISSFVGSKKSEKAAKKQAAAQAAIDRKVTAEEVRVLEQDQRTAYGETIAGYAGGGVKAVAPNLTGETTPMSGSPLTILAEQTAEFGRLKEFTQDVGAANAQATLARGRNLANQYRYQGYANVANSITNILTGGAGGGPMWGG